MRSILDYTLEADYSKHFKLSLENDLSEESTNLKPTIEFGLGWGISDKMLSSYFLPKLGYRYNQYGNLYFLKFHPFQMPLKYSDMLKS